MLYNKKSFKKTTNNQKLTVELNAHKIHLNKTKNIQSDYMPINFIPIHTF